MAFGHFRRTSSSTLNNMNPKTSKWNALLSYPALKSGLVRCLSANRYLDPAAEVERQRWKPRSGIIVLAGQVFYCRIELNITVQMIAAADIDLLVSLS